MSAPRKPINGSDIAGTLGRRRIVSAAVLLPLLGVQRAAAQGTSPAGGEAVRVIVPYPPGGTTDIVGRLVAEGLGRRLSRSVVVENRSGAAGIVGSDVVAKGPADGSVLLANFSPPHAVLKSLYTRLPFDPLADFTAVGSAAATSYVLVVHPELPAANVPELIAHIRARPGQLSFASNGAGTMQHLLGEVFKRDASLDMVHVAYRGSAQSQADILAGRITMAFDNVAVMLPQVRRGALRGLAITAPSRLSLAPDIPTMRELGFPQAEAEATFFLLAPARTPAAVVASLNEAVRAVVQEESFVQKVAELSARPVPNGAAESQDLLRQQETQWGRLIEELGIRLE